MPLLSDVVLAADHAVFHDSVHFRTNAVPGDGAHVVWPYLLGPRRGKHFLLTAQKLSAQQAYEWGAVSEVVAAEKLSARAWQLATEFTRRSKPVLRYTREALNIVERATLLSGLGYGLALEGAGDSDADPWRH